MMTPSEHYELSTHLLVDVEEAMHVGTVSNERLAVVIAKATAHAMLAGVRYNPTNVLHEDEDDSDVRP